ncbi:hypothetical protein GSY74_00195 [Sulfurovum sp. bin170]|nr:hypothetical protein [Sulfurovum sp. bin170]
METTLPNSSDFTEFNTFENNLSSHSYDIEGRYKLHRGLYMNGNVNQGEITNAYMVIEKLDDNDFGYYFADKMQTLTAQGTFGVFHYDEKSKKFHQKFIDGDSFVIRKGGIALIKGDNKIKLTIRQTAGRKVIIWEKIKRDTIGMLDETIDDAMDDAKDSYEQVYESKREAVIDDSSFFGFF